MTKSEHSKSAEDVLSMPAMKPARDEVLQRQRQSQRASAPRGALLVLRLLFWLALPLLFYMLWQQQQQATLRAQQAEHRIAQLESLLASTGDELSQSDSVVRAQLKSLDSEVRKLWDNVWKKSKETFASQQHALEELSAADSELKKNQQLVQSQARQFSAEISRYSTVLGALSDSLDVLEGDFIGRDQHKIYQQQERDFLLKQIHLLERRVAVSEEWIESINTFRQQVNRALLLRAELPSDPPELQ